jgi:hypothetical protein
MLYLSLICCDINTGPYSVARGTATRQPAVQYCLTRVANGSRTRVVGEGTVPTANPTAIPTAIVKLTVIERNALLDAAAMVYRAVWTPEVSNGHVQLVEDGV